jgi:two-component system cell cycle response regulator
MTARVLVVDDIVTNVKLLEARLTAEYFDVVTAMSGPEAIAASEKSPCDIVLLDVMMPGMDGFEVCRRLKSNPRTHHVPVVMVTALDQPADRVRGLEAGADDFLTKPVSDIALVTRVRSLVRLKQLTDELRLRAATSAELGLDAAESTVAEIDGRDGRILLVDDRRSSQERIVQALRGVHRVEVEGRPQEAVFRAAEGDYDLLVVSLALSDFDGLRLCSQVRSIERVRNLPILILVDPDEDARLLRGLDMGVNDYLVRPVDKNELLARAATQIKRKRYGDRLRETVTRSVEMAVTDGLTGLYNRRYMEGHLATLAHQAAHHRKDLSLLVLDIDYFKSVNDTYGHDAGDDVLREFARRLRKAVRGIDLVCRFGGEEFVVVMPEADAATAMTVAERIRERVAATPFPIAGRTREIPITLSVGVASANGPADTPETLMKRADQAVYAAKRDGRNRVVAHAA